MPASLQHAIEVLSEASPEVRAQKVDELGIEALDCAWRSGADAADLALLAVLLGPRDAVTHGLVTCMRSTMSRHVERDPSVAKMLEAAERLVAPGTSREAAERVFADLGAPPELDTRAWTAHAALVNLYKYLFDDVKRGIEGVIFFCAESALSKDHRTWESAMSKVAEVFRGAVPSPFNPEAKA